jgi:hypothetical protein
LKVTGIRKECNAQTNKAFVLKPNKALFFKAHAPQVYKLLLKAYTPLGCSFLQAIRNK